MDVDDEELIGKYRVWGVDRDNAFRFRGYADRQLLGRRCRACGRWHEPPGTICPSCWSAEVDNAPLSGNGTVFMAIFLHQGPPAEGVDYSTPHPVVAVELDEQPGLRFTSTVVGATNDEITIGRRVRLDWAERGGAPFPVFRLEGTR